VVENISYFGNFSTEADYDKQTNNLQNFEIALGLEQASNITIIMGACGNVVG
jgi:hypothetical protein